MAERLAPLREVAYERFREQLLGGTPLRPGAFVSQRELADLLDVPLGAVREALKRLEAEGLVTLFAQRGVQIRDVNVALINDAFDLRIVLEREAVRRAARSNAERDALEKLRTRTQAVIDAASRSIDDALLEETMQADLALHALILRAFDNALAQETYRVLDDKVRLIRMNRNYIAPRVIAAMEEHLAIIDALLAGDVERAEAALDKHLRTSWRRSLGLPADDDAEAGAP